MDDRDILTIKNTVVNSLNIQIAGVVLERKHVFFSANLVEMGDDQAMAIGTEFPHPNHGLKIHALDAKMAASKATFMMHNC
jgi:hypothetical protein